MTASGLPTVGGDLGVWGTKLNTYLSDRFGPIFNVKADHGAVGNGVADDSAAIQAAINAASAASGVVAFPPATYGVGSGISVPSNVSLVSLIPGKATIKALNAISGYHMVYALGVSSTVSNVGFYGLVFDANSVGGPTFVLSLGGVYDARVIGCTLKNGSAAGNSNAQVIVCGGTASFMGTLNTERVLFRDCEIGPSLSTGLMFTGGSGGTADVANIKNVVIENCYVHDNARSGIENLMNQSRTVQSVHVTHCRFERNLIGAHVNDGFRWGWADLDVGHNYFGVGDPLTTLSGGVSDHNGRDIRIHHNHFEMGCVTSNYHAFPVAFGENNNARTLTAATASGTTATFTSAAHGFADGTKIWVRGVTPDAYNGYWVISSHAANTFVATIAVSNPGAGTAFGTAEPWTNRTIGIWVEDNYFYDCTLFDGDSCFDLFIRRNRFEKIRDRAIGLFGHMNGCFVEDNTFIECGQTPSTSDEYNKAAVSTGPGVTFRRNNFRDNQTPQTTKYGIYEFAGSPFTEQPIVYDDNDFGNVANPVLFDATYTRGFSTWLPTDRSSVVAAEYEIVAGQVLELAANTRLEIT